MRVTDGTDGTVPGIGGGFPAEKLVVVVAAAVVTGGGIEGLAGGIVCGIVDGIFGIGGGAVTGGLL